MNPLTSAKHSPLLSPAVLGVIVSVIAATAESLFTPLLKLTSADTGIMMSLTFVFLGSGCGLLLMRIFGRKSKSLYDPERRPQKKDTGKILGFIFISLVAITFLLQGARLESSTTAAILQNITPVVTVLLAALLLKEKISKRLGIGVALIVLGSVALTVTNPSTLSFSSGSLFVIIGSILLGCSYVISKRLADRNPVEILTIRGFGMAAVTLIAALVMGEQLPSLQGAAGLMITGFIGTGVAFLFMMYGQRHIGAAKSGAIYSIYPLLGVLISIPLFGEMPTASLLAALILFIPGMYFVITKSSGKTAEQKPADEVVRKDAEYFKSISDAKKAGMKNHLTSFGFLIVAIFFVLMVFGVFESGTADAVDVFSSGMLVPGLIFGTVLLLIGIILLILGKRVLTAVTFILLVPGILSFVILGNNPIMSAVSGIFSIIFAFILLTSKDPQKYAFAAVNALLGAAFISNIFSSTVCGIIVSAASVFLIWLSIACGTGKLQRFIAKHLTEDGDMTFSRCGAVIGFLLIAQFMAIQLVYDFLMDAAIYATDAYLAIGTVNALLTAFVGVMLLFIGKRQMTAVFFFGVSVAMLLGLFCNSVFCDVGLLYLPVIFGLLFGILVVLRGASLILPTALLFGGAFALLLYLQSAAVPEVLTAMYLITLGCAAVAVYLAFAVFSEKPKLPVF